MSNLEKKFIPGSHRHDYLYDSICASQNKANAALDVSGLQAKSEQCSNTSQPAFWTCGGGQSEQLSS